MKNIYVIISVLLIFCMLLIPLLSLGGERSESKNAETEKEPMEAKKETVTVLINETGKTESMKTEDYIFGVVAAEIPAQFCEETIKAQAVAAYTYLKYKQIKNADKPYDITDSPSSDQHYINSEKAMEKWGKNGEEYSIKIKNAIESVKGEFIAYNNEPILALYHAISGGKTEDVTDVFGSDEPYLISRESIGDLLCEDYQCLVSVSIEEFKKLYKNPENLKDEPINWIKAVNHRENGYVESVMIGEETLKGTEIRSMFSLRSANFDIAFDGVNFNFTVRGYGHGVGLSQEGAEYMAKQGGTYKEILLWYYKNCEILKEN